MQTVLELARRHPDSPVPRTEKELREFYAFRDFPHFSAVYGAVSSLVTEAEDVADLVRGIARDLAAENVRYIELTVSPYTLVRNGLTPAAITQALDVGAADALALHGVRIGYIFDFRGQTADVDAERIGHGLNCLADSRLVAYLRESQLPLEVCPTSNFCTRQVTDLARHPLPRMLAEGLFVTLNSDDPPMFGTTLSNEYLVAASVLGLGRKELAMLAANAVQASFLDDGAKESLIREIASVAALVLPA